MQYCDEVIPGICSVSRGCVAVDTVVMANDEVTVEGLNCDIACTMDKGVSL